MDIQGVLRWGTEELSSLEHSHLEAEVLLCAVLKCDRMVFKTHPEKKVSWWPLLLYKKCVQQRRKNMPVAYIVGHKEWGGMRIFVNRHVLIPRDETEILCEHITAERRKNIHRHILDVGTGSGCIALFLARVFPSAKITALDNDSDALRVARKNFSKSGLRVEILRSNLLEKISAHSEFDLVVANLPYVPEKFAVTPEVGKEPRQAIFSGRDGLDLMRQFAGQLIEKKNTFFRTLA